MEAKVSAQLLSQKGGEASTKLYATSCPEVGPLGSPLLVPLVLLFAAYVVYVFPERGVAVLLLLCALATFGPTSEPMVSCMAGVLERVALRAASSPGLRLLAREQLRAALSDPHTQEEFTRACRQSLVEAMADEGTQDVMVSCCSKSVTVATIAASQDESLQRTLNVAMRTGVKDALSDESLVTTIFNVLKEGLRDPKMHAAALKGAVTAANPLKDFSVPALAQSKNPLKAVKETLKEVIVDAEAKSLANASGLSRAPPPRVQGPRGSEPPSECFYDATLE